jgi:lipopolysaccharide/colanic/teichoic acid biosynthesis glycosyltransferase
VPASAAGRLEFGARSVGLPLSRRYRFCKRVLDVCGATALLILGLPFIVCFACLIRLEEGGPLFYRRRVIGPGGAFDAFKLRSMRVDADQILERDPQLRRQFSINFKLKDDPRVTRVGEVMRRFSIDELPQLWNILCGQMSLVGPRMITPNELDKFGDAGWIFSCVKPGLTGYWQVQAQREPGYESRAKMEQWYAEHRSLTLDLKILLKTPLRVLRGQENG